MSISDRLRTTPGGLPGAITRIIIRALQFILALTVAGLYGTDLQHGRQAGLAADGKWVFAEVVAGLSAVTVLVYTATYAIDFHPYCFAWDWVVFILWTALFGLMGKIYISAEPAPGLHGLRRMKNAVWVDLVNMLLWFATALWLTLRFWTRGGKRTLHTGQAVM